MSNIQQRRQTLPPDAAALLQELHAQVHPARLGGPRGKSPERRAAWERLSAYICRLTDADWTLQSVANALGMSFQGVRSITRLYPPAAENAAGLPDAPPLPSKPAKPSKPAAPKAPPLPADLRDELAGLREQSRDARGPIQGTGRENSPEWRASTAFAARVHELTTDGPYTVYGVAQALGVTVKAVTQRLDRHGYRRTLATRPGPAAVTQGSRHGR